MDQHPIPRNITGFEFQLIGTMTLKQFAYIAFGAIIAFIFYKSPLSILRFPLAGFSLFMGVAFAFLSIQERPLEIWIINFIKSVTSPTQFVWQKEDVKPTYLEKRRAVKPPTAKETQNNLSQHQEAKQKLNAYLQSVKPGTTQALDENEQQFLQKLSPYFSQQSNQKQEKSSFAQSLGSLFKPKPKQQAKIKPQIKTAPRTILAPGVIDGIIKDEENSLPGIIINIKNLKGEVVRMLKSASDGRFSLKLPLPEGDYTVEIEDPNNKHVFGSFNFKVGSQGTTPWLIRPKNHGKS